MKMRKTKRQRWDKVGLSQERDGLDLRLTIRRKAECTKCERNDNMGDRPIHNLLIIFKCLLGRYKIDNFSIEYYLMISAKNNDATRNRVKHSAR